MRLVYEQPGSGGPPPLLTIVLCAYQHEAFIEQALASIDDAAGSGPIELLVIDDGSADATLAIACAHRFDPRLAVRVFTKPNGGHVSSLKAGLQRASAPYLLPASADDYHAPGGLPAAIKAYRSRGVESTVTVFGGIYTPGDERDPNPRGRQRVYLAEQQRLFARSPGARYRWLCRQFPGPLLIGSTIFPVALLREIGAWDGTVELDDWPTFIAVARAEASSAARIEYRPETILFEYRLHGGGMHTDLARSRRMLLEVAGTVPKRHRRACTAFVHRQMALNHLHRGEWRAAWSEYAANIAADPGPVALLTLPVRVALTPLRRAVRALSGRAARGPRED